MNLPDTIMTVEKGAGAAGAKLSVDSKKRLISTAPDGIITLLDDIKEYKAE